MKQLFKNLTLIGAFASLWMALTNLMGMLSSELFHILIRNDIMNYSTYEVINTIINFLFMCGTEIGVICLLAFFFMEASKWDKMKLAALSGGLGILVLGVISFMSFLMFNVFQLYSWSYGLNIIFGLMSMLAYTLVGAFFVWYVLVYKKYGIQLVTAIVTVVLLFLWFIQFVLNVFFSTGSALYWINTLLVIAVFVLMGISFLQMRKSHAALTDQE